MNTYRDGEFNGFQNRKPRFTQKECGNWFFYSREGFELGPYDSCEEAEVGLETYLEFLNHASPKVLEHFFATYAP